MDKTDLFSERVRELRERKAKTDPSSFSIRKVAQRIDVEPSYLSKIERGLVPPPGEETIKALAKELDENEDVLLGLAGKISTEVKNIIRRRPQKFAELIRALKGTSEKDLDKLVRVVHDGDW